MIDRMSPDYDDEETHLSIDELSDLKALHDEEEWRERKYGSKYETMETDL